MAKTLVLFDFDHTLYAKDSLLEFTRFCKGNRAFILGITRLFPYLGGLQLRLLNNEKVKQTYFSHFFRGMDSDIFSASAHAFALQKIEPGLNPKMAANFRKHLESGHEVYIITASAAQWIQPWSEPLGVTVIGTKLEIKDNQITGKFSSRNCYGPQKVSRIQEILNLEEYDAIFVYGSGKGDREMLQLQKSPIR